MQAFECLHEIGYIYNDLKLENILIGASTDSKDTLDTNDSSKHQIKLIDFGLATRYLDSSGHHVKDEMRDHFIGNMALGSAHTMSFQTASRRDDLVSLCYLLVLMIQG